jgi:two-component system chemotaxis response regulator CheB
MVSRKILQELSFETEEAVDGKDALEACKRKVPDAVLLDWNMPVMDGLIALAPNLKVDPYVKLIIASTLTGHNADISLRALRAGAADYIPKPTIREISSGAGFRRDLLLKVRALGAGRRPGAGRVGGSFLARRVNRVSAFPIVVLGSTVVLRQAGSSPPTS